MWKTAMNRVFLALPILALGSAGGASSSLAAKGIALVEAFQAPRLGEKASVLSSFSWSHGSLRLQITSGSATPILVEGQPVGLFIQGEGVFAYEAKDPITHPLLRFNTQENTRIEIKKTDKNLWIEEPIKQAVLWMLGMKLPELPMGTLAPPVDAFEKAMRQETILNAADTRGACDELSLLPIGQAEAYRRAHAPDAALFYADIDSKKERFRYVHDPVRARWEALMIHRPVQTEDFGIYAPLVVLDYAPVGWTRKQPQDPPVHLFHIKLDMEATTAQKAKYSLVEHYKIIKPGLRMLSLAYSGRASRKPGSKRSEHPGSALQRVLLGGTTPLAFVHTGGFLMVDLGRAYQNGDKLELTFEVEGDLLGEPNDFNYWRLVPGENWFPEPDTSAQGYTLEAKVSIPKPFVVIASGQTDRRTETSTHNILEASLKKPTVWFSLAGGKYTSQELVKDGLTVRAWGYSGVGHGVKPLLKTSHGILGFYKHLFGDLPFPEINLVEVPSLGFGQAPAGMIWLTREAFSPIGDDLNRIVASQGAVTGWVNRLVSHEIAHQYWAHVVKMWGFEDQWITESFSEYTSALAMRVMRGKGEEAFNIIVKDWKNTAEQARQASAIPTANFLYPQSPTHAYFRKSLIYDKGAYLLARLHKEMGDTLFYRFLRTYQKRLAWYPPSYNQDVADLLKAVTGKDHQKWLDDHIWGIELPPQ